MDKVIRVSSNQGFSDTWTNAAAPNSLNLCDFVMPSGNYDLSKSYIAFNASITSNDPNPMNATMYLDTDNGEKYNVPVSALIRNCNIQNDRGMIESIRRADTLNCGLFGMLDNAEDRKNNLNTLACYTGPRGIGNKTSYFLDCVTDNVSPDGTAIDATNVSRQISRDLKIPLNELFGVANSEAYSTDVFGETRIHLETNFARVKAEVLGGSEATDNGFDGATAWGAFEAINTIPGGQDAGSLAYPLISTLPYDNWELTFPFFVGQRLVTASATASAGTAMPALQECIVKSIRYQNSNTATPPTGGGKVYMTLERPDGTGWWPNDSGGNANVTGITFNAKTDQTLSMTINRADLVLETSSVSPDQSISYETYTTEEDTPAQGITSFSKAYRLESECPMFMVMCCNSGAILPNRSIESYRYAIDNVEQTGNRDIEVCTGTFPGAGARHASPLQIDRLVRALDHQAGLGFRNAQMRFYKNSNTQALAYDAPVSVIAETCPATAEDKILNLEIASAAGLQDLKIYKQIRKTI